MNKAGKHGRQPNLPRYQHVDRVSARTRTGGENALLNAMLVAPFDDRSARRAARLPAELQRRNQDLGIKDTLIAATCLEYDLPLLTLNDRHFAQVPDLQVVTTGEFLAP